MLGFARTKKNLEKIWMPITTHDSLVLCSIQLATCCWPVLSSATKKSWHCSGDLCFKQLNSISICTITAFSARTTSTSRSLNTLRPLSSSSKPKSGSMNLTSDGERCFSRLKLTLPETKWTTVITYQAYKDKPFSYS